MKWLLFPLSWLYQLGSSFRNYLYDQKLRPIHRPPLPVVSVGNISFGGSEKTPLARFLLHFYHKLGFRPALISRGYKGRWEKRGGIVSDGHQILATWEDAGDEPYMIAREFPSAGVFVGRHRLLSCHRAHQLGFNLAILDDGFQHRQLARDLDIVLYHPRPHYGRRESLSSLQRADIILIKKDTIPPPDQDRPSPKNASLPPQLANRKIFFYQVQPDGFYTLRGNSHVPIESLRSRKLIAFCGIAAPHRFFALLHHLGIKLAANLSYPDHFSYPSSVLNQIKKLFHEKKADFLCTTEKDAVKLEERPETAGWPLIYLKIKIKPDEEFCHELERIAQSWLK